MLGEETSGHSGTGTAIDPDGTDTSWFTGVAGSVAGAGVSSLEYVSLVELSNLLTGACQDARRD